jgi:heme/copper-type cytochrome/quinol oxidase subunit 2
VLFNYKINNTDITEKMSQVEQFWGFRQKRYKKLRSFSFPVMSKFNSATYSYMDNFVNDKFDKYQAYTAVKNNKYRNESIPVSLARRLLRTKRTLILPAHINITLITGSYDVVHSWFIPGLGLKMDCVPGRSTHHSLYIDNIGFYYGQCAEICGRYHHHMPIRVCALPFEHFLLWWQTKGLPRMYRSKAFLENKSILLNKLT